MRLMTNKLILTFLIVSFLFSLGGCSVGNSKKVLPPQKSSAVVKPEKPIIKSRVAINKPIVVPNKKSVMVVKPYKPQIYRYRDSKSEVRILTAEEQAAFNKALVQIEKNKREVSDPYALIPDDSTTSIRSNTSDNELKNTSTTRKPKAQSSKSKSAVDSLMLQARAEILIGKYLSAESKIERGLRIAPENPKLWALLAKSHYGQANYSQSINMARKAIQFSSNDDLTARSWRLIKKAGEKSGDMPAVKEATDYIKINP